MAARRERDDWVSPRWGWSWPANRRMLYNRASADPDGQPWSERKRYVWWDDAKGNWTGVDVPDFEAGKPPGYLPKPGAQGMDAIGGGDPFIMKPDGKGWIYVPKGLKDGPLPTFYEPAESPASNQLYEQQHSPLLRRMEGPLNPLAIEGSDRYQIVVTTYRLTEHHLSGPMSRWVPWLSELQPAMFCELSPELAEIKGIQNADWMVVSSPRGEIETRALVTRRIRPFRRKGRTIHEVGLPMHFGFKGVVTGGMANDLASLVLEPNVSIHEAKAFVCDVRPGRLTR